MIGESNCFISNQLLFVISFIYDFVVRCLFSGGPIAAGSSRIFWSLGKYDAVAVAGLGKSSDWHELDNINGKKENVRVAAAGKPLIDDIEISICKFSKLVLFFLETN